MNTKITTYICAFVLVLSVVFISQSTYVYASSTILNRQGQRADSLTKNNVVLTVSKEADTVFSFYVPGTENITLTIYDSKGNVYGNTQHLTKGGAVWVLDGRGWYTTSFTINQMPKGNYTVEYIFDEATSYDIKVVQQTATASLESKKETLTVGFSKKLTISNGKAKSWTSSKKSVATVSSNGTVKAKKAGKTIITATLSNGKKLKCTVTVKANKYTANKLTSDYVGMKEYAVKAYSASYKSNGSIVVKFSVVNETDQQLSTIPNFNVTVINQKSETIVNYTKASYKINVPTNSSKDFTITIPKSSIIGSKADLRNSVINISGDRAT